MGAKEENLCGHGKFTHGLRDHFGTKEEYVEILDTYGAGDGRVPSILEFIYLPKKHDAIDNPKVEPHYVGETFQSVVNDELGSTEYHILRNSAARILELEIRVKKF